MRRTHYFNGNYVVEGQAQISVHDFGFNYGSGIYEVTYIFNQTLFQLETHLDRLERSCREIGVQIDREEVKRVGLELIERNQERDGFLYIQVTYGAYERRQMALPDPLQPTILIYTSDFIWAKPVCYREGVSLGAVLNRRWRRCDIKSTALLSTVMSLQEAKTRGFYDLIFVEEDGEVTESSSANLFLVQEGVLITPPTTSQLLAGITRQTILDLARSHGIPYQERRVTLRELQSADEAFITSTTKGLLPVRTVENKVLVHSPGPMTLRLTTLWKGLVTEETGCHEFHF